MYKKSNVLQLFIFLLIKEWTQMASFVVLVAPMYLASNLEKETSGYLRPRQVIAPLARLNS